jgi:FdhD protein
VRRLEILRLAEQRAERVEDLVTEEIALSVLAEHRRLAVLLCSPADLEDLVRGFFYTNGFIEQARDVRSIVVNRATGIAFVGLAPEIDVDRLPARGLITSGCGSAAAPGNGEFPHGCGPVRRAGEDRDAAAGARFAPWAITGLMQEFARLSEVHRQTGGVHAAALADGNGILLFREDIGRHNAVDKVIGAWLAGQQGAPPSLAGGLLLSSGRLTSEIVVKAARCGLPVVVSRSAPTDRAVSLAREAGLTLIGFARGTRMNVYSGFERIEGASGRIENGGTV